MWEKLCSFIKEASFYRKLCKISHTTDDFPATRLLGVDPSASDLQRRTFFRGAHHLAVVAHANHADTAARQNLPVTVLHILEETVAGWDLWNKSADFSCNPPNLKSSRPTECFQNFTLKLRNERKQLSATAVFFILKNNEETISKNKSANVDWKFMHLERKLDFVVTVHFVKLRFWKYYEKFVFQFL